MSVYLRGVVSECTDLQSRDVSYRRVSHECVSHGRCVGMYRSTILKFENFEVPNYGRFALMSRGTMRGIVMVRWGSTTKPAD